MSAQIAPSLAIIAGAVAVMGPATAGINRMITGKPRKMYMDPWKHRMMARDEAITHFHTEVEAQRLADEAEAEAAKGEAQA